MKTGILLVSLLTISLFSNAQNPLEDPYNNRPLVKNITTPVLKDLEANQPVEFEKVKYLYTRSFRVERIHCENCKVDYFELFNLDLFDVSEFEQLRAKTTEVSFDYKDKYRVILLSHKTVLAAYNTIREEAEEQLVSSTSTELPLYNDTGDMAVDYQNYQAALVQYQADYPADYLTHTSISGFLTISFDEFSVLPANRRASVLNHPKGYVIINNHPIGALNQ